MLHGITVKLLGFALALVFNVRGHELLRGISDGHRLPIFPIFRSGVFTFGYFAKNFDRMLSSLLGCYGAKAADRNEPPRGRAADAPRPVAKDERFRAGRRYGQSEAGNCAIQNYEPSAIGCH